MINNIPDLQKLQDEFLEFLGEEGAGKKFKPLAYYDEQLDCIRVLTKDCSVFETRIDEYFTILDSNHPKNGDKLVGFTIKGVAHLFRQIDVEIGQITNVTDLLDKIAKSMPSAVSVIATGLKERLEKQEAEPLEVEWEEAA